MKRKNLKTLVGVISLVCVTAALFTGATSVCVEGNTALIATFVLMGIGAISAVFACG